MPSYTYMKEDGTLVTMVMTITEKEERQDHKGIIVLKDGSTAKRVWEPCGVPAATGWPKNSTSCGVAPNQCAEAEAEARKLGVPTNFDRKTGDAIFDSAAHQKKYLKKHKMIDHDSFI